MEPLIKIVLGLLATIAVGLLSIQFDVLPGSAATVETALKDQINIALSDPDFRWAEVEINGQQAILKGAAPSPEAAQNAQETIFEAAGSGGVILGGVTFVNMDDVSDPSSLPVVSPFLWGAERQSGALVLSGYAPGEKARTEVFDLAQSIFGETEISGDLELANGAPPEDEWLTAVSASLHALAQLEGGAVEAVGSKFVLTGIAKSATRATTLSRMMSMLPEGFEGSAEIIAAPTPLPDANSSFDSSAAEEISALAATQDASISEAGAQYQFDITLDQEKTDACRKQLRDKISSDTTRFESSGAALGATSRSFLAELSDIMLRCPQFSYEIVGHTDSSGDSAGNIRLSRARSEAVREVLVNNGVSPDRVTARGAGDAVPIADNATPEGRQANRRIEVDLIFDPQ